MANSFFGFDPTKPPDRGHDSHAPGFGPTPNAFAAFDNTVDDGETFDFDDEYQGDLGAQLDETGDADNDATFGAGPVRNDFDFSGQSFFQDARPQQQQQPPQQAQQPQYHPRQEPPKPARTGYESYKPAAGRMPDLAPSASIWGPPALRQEPQSHAPPQHSQQPSLSAASRKVMSLDEVEAMMRTQVKKPTPQPAPQGPVMSPPPQHLQQQLHEMPTPSPGFTQQSQQTQYMQQAQQPVPQTMQQQGPPRGGAPPIVSGQQIPLPFHDRRQSQNQGQGAHPIAPQMQSPPSGPTQILRRPQQSGHDRRTSAPREAGTHHRGPSLGGRPVTHPDQITQLSEQQRAEFMADEANRAKRNHKIHMLSRDNGLMTPQDKNFILRIQLQQLVTATGGTDERGPEAMLAEDFYYQVFSQIRGGPVSGNTPAGSFAQAYLNQLSWQRGGSRRYPRGGENHMRRMEQQVQRAVEAAKARPKNKQLVVEGSLGKISFSNSKTPKPLLNLKRPDGTDPQNNAGGRPRPHETIAGRKAVLRNIERCYNSLMKIEDHERSVPLPPREESPADEIQGFMEWRQLLNGYNKELWEDLRMQEPIDMQSSLPHPFIAILSHPKGKKLIPRVFRQIDDQQRVQILTMIVVQLDLLDVIRLAQPTADGEIAKGVRDEVDLFAQAVEPSIFAYISDAALSIVFGLVGLMTDRMKTRTNTQMVVQTRTGVNLLTRLISRAVLILQSNHVEEPDANQWTATYTRLFEVLEPYLAIIFQTPVESNEDFYVWQFLAALGIGANQEQQQRLVIGVKDRVMDSVQHAKKLPEEEGKPRLDKVNLFMHAIGLDVDLLG